MARLVLAGDIGGTKTNLAIYAVGDGGRPSAVREASFASREYAGLEDVLAAFLRPGAERVTTAAFGIAGPVFENVVVTTNLPWVVEADRIASALGGARVRLLNDLEATAYGALFLPPAELHVLNAGREKRGNRAVIAAGTGLGQAFLFWDGARFRPAATEGGHADFAPRNDLETGLLTYLVEKYGRVSYERVLSGPGLANVFGYFVERLGRPVEPSIRARLASEDVGAVVGQAGVSGACATCAEALDLFVSLYGAQAGNLALAVMGTGGVYVGGGIVTRILPKVLAGDFMRSFTTKGRYSGMMADIPVRIVLNAKTGLLGAAHAATELEART